jgi:hypothetical protein
MGAARSIYQLISIYLLLMMTVLYKCIKLLANIMIVYMAAPAAAAAHALGSLRLGSKTRVLATATPFPLPVS